MYKIKTIEVKHTAELAEIMGIILGDGGLYPAQVNSNKFSTIVVFNKLEKNYLNYVKSLFEKHFYPYRFYSYNAHHTLMLLNQSVYVGKYLLESGMILGDKIRSKVVVPKWIFQKKLLKFFIKGIFDTDGCIYRKYDNYAQIQFKFGSYHLTLSVRKALTELNFNPTIIKEEFHSKGGTGVNWKFCLCKQLEIKRFFEIIKPMNQKHVERFNRIWGRREFPEHSSF